MEEKIKKPKKVLIFGVFDKLHDGHRFFIEEASKLGDILTIVVAPEESVLLHKGRMPRETVSVRRTALSQSFPKAQVISGDTVSGSWNVLLQEQPDIIALGYDQKALQIALENFYAKKDTKPIIVSIVDHRGDELHTSLLH